MNSVWQKGVDRVDFPPLNKSIKTNVLIIGGGMAGILTAYMLHNSGVDCVLVEAKNICSGVTENTTAKITLHHGAIYSKLIQRFGYEKAELFLKAQIEACEQYSKLCQKINCDYEVADSIVYSVNNAEKIKNEAAALNSLGLKAQFMAQLDLPFKVAGGVKVNEQAQFNPLKFATKISAGLKYMKTPRC